MKIVKSMTLPVIMFIIMFVLCRVNGVKYFGTLAMWKTLITDIAFSASCAYGIGLQFKNGRFDFSGVQLCFFLLLSLET
jgi:hypothetical protein